MNYKLWIFPFSSHFLQFSVQLWQVRRKGRRKWEYIWKIIIHATGIFLPCHTQERHIKDTCTSLIPNLFAIKNLGYDDVSYSLCVRTLLIANAVTKRIILQFRQCQFHYLWQCISNSIYFFWKQLSNRYTIKIQWRLYFD